MLIPNTRYEESKTFVLWFGRSFGSITPYRHHFRHLDVPVELFEVCKEIVKVLILQCLPRASLSVWIFRFPREANRFQSINPLFRQLLLEQPLLLASHCLSDIRDETVQPRAVLLGHVEIPL